MVAGAGQAALMVPAGSEPLAECLRVFPGASKRGPACSNAIVTVPYLCQLP